MLEMLNSHILWTMGPFISSFASVSVSFSCMLLITLSGIFNNVELEIGLEHYAEVLWLSFVDFMPLNTLINAGYVGVGVYWCAFGNTANSHGVLKGYDVHLYYAFNLMASLYGFIQTARIVTQRVVWAVLDQWCTLPFFMLLLIWGLYYQYGWSHRRCAVLIFLSVFSYVLTLFSQIGFEICLACHIVCALTGGLLAFHKHPASSSLISLWAALFSCLGFVVLKLLDLKLASMCFVFKYVSGHFLSKICDVCQIYFVNTFFFDLALQKAVDLSIDDKNKWISKDEKIRKRTGEDILYKNPVTLKAKRL